MQKEPARSESLSLNTTSVNNESKVHAYIYKVRTYSVE